MAGRHRSRNKSIQIIRTATVAAKDCKRVSSIQFHVSFKTTYLLARFHGFFPNWLIDMIRCCELWCLFSCGWHFTYYFCLIVTELQDQVPSSSPHPQSFHQAAAHRILCHQTQHSLPINNRCCVILSGECAIYIIRVWLIVICTQVKLVMHYCYCFGLYLVIVINGYYCCGAHSCSMACECDAVAIFFKHWPIIG